MYSSSKKPNNYINKITSKVLVVKMSFLYGEYTNVEEIYMLFLGLERL